MNVLSLFDGMSCGQLALNKAGIHHYTYYASEIDNNAIKITQKNFPDTIQLGDITKIDGRKLPKIDLIMGGSPCQGFSIAGKQLNFNDERSRLFFEFVRILNEVREKNPDVKFLLENVNMKKEYRDIITRFMGVEPVKINSISFVPQNRPRLYWTNMTIGLLPADTKPFLIEILFNKDVPDLDKIKLSEKAIAYMGRLRNGKPRWEYHKNELFGDAACLTANMYKGVPYGVIKEWERRLHPIECERLQGVPDNYTEGVSFTERYKMLGNGWTINVIEHILKSLYHEDKR